MKIKFIYRKSVVRAALFFGLLIAFASAALVGINAQTPKKTKARATKSKAAASRKTAGNVKNTKSASIKVTQIDRIALENLLKRDAANNKPLLVNFWATWCDPCREEFPDLVKIDAEYKGKIDFITVSLDDLAEINRDVPKFLLSMRAPMPAYLLKTADEEAAIAAVSKEWKGGLPFTILIDKTGAIVYSRQGKVELEKLRGELDKFTKTAGANFTGEPKTIDPPNL